MHCSKDKLDTLLSAEYCKILIDIPDFSLIHAKVYT